MKEVIQVIMPLLLVVACCSLIGIDLAGKGFIFLGLSSSTWGTLAGVGAIMSFALLFLRRSC